MRLPNADRAVVERAKIAEYLLNPEHPDNGGKAVFFVTLEFSRSDWDTFANALRKLALTADVTESMETVHGKKYIVDGELENPAGKGGSGAFDLDCRCRNGFSEVGNRISSRKVRRDDQGTRSGSVN